MAGTSVSGGMGVEALDLDMICCMTNVESERFIEAVVVGAGISL